MRILTIVGLSLLGMSIRVFSFLSFHVFCGGAGTQCIDVVGFELRNLPDTGDSVDHHAQRTFPYC